MTGAKSEPQGPLGGAGYAVFLEQKVRWGEGRRSEASGQGSDHEEPADQSSIYPTKAMGECWLCAGPGWATRWVRTGTRQHSLALVELTF